MFSNHKKKFEKRKRYSVWKREPYYDLVEKHLPSDKSARLVDIGAGEGGFVDRLKLAERFDNVYLLDHNEQTVASLSTRYEHVHVYSAPDRLPFDDGTVDLVHCSHMIEHLYHGDLYVFVNEVDRVLAPGGVFVISTPLLWDSFYNDLSHVKPYNPDVLIHYLCSETKQRSAEVISTDYQVEELVFRLFPTRPYLNWGSENFFVNVVIEVLRRFLNKLQIKHYIRNGYTLVLRKCESS